MIHNTKGTVFSSEDDPFMKAALSQFVENAYTTRTDLVNTALHSRKEINKECDYPETEAIKISDYQNMYDRNPIASRVVTVLPDESWQVMPTLFEDEDAAKTTKFEKSFEELGKQLYGKGEESWYEGNENQNPIWRYLHLADSLSGIGHFGLILIGVDDSKSLDQPANGFKDFDPSSTSKRTIFVSNETKESKLLYLSVFSENAVTSIEFETNESSPRYRKPKYYQLDLGDASHDYVASGRQGKSIRVHWSRVVHIADNMHTPSPSEIIAIPRMRPVWNNCLDLLKVYGGDAEGFWKNCVMRIFLESHPQLGADVTIDADTLKERMWDMENGLQRWAALLGMSAKTIAPTVVDPTAHINTQIEAICIKIPIPKRVFMGSERGELASGQDDSSWNDTLRGRRTQYLIPRVIVPFINRLIQLGVLVAPKKYGVAWEDPENVKPLEQAEVANKRIEAMTKYVAGGVSALMDPMDLFTKELGYEEDEARGILERAEEAQEEAEKEEQEKLAEQQALQGEVIPGEEQKLEDGVEPPDKEPKEEAVGNVEGESEVDDPFELTLHGGKHDQKTHGRPGPRVGDSITVAPGTKLKTKKNQQLIGKEAKVVGTKGKTLIVEVDGKQFRVQAGKVTKVDGTSGVKKATKKEAPKKEITGKEDPQRTAARGRTYTDVDKSYTRAEDKQKPFNKLELEGLQEYTGSSDEINSELRDGGLMKNQPKSTRALNSRTRNSLPEETIVYRGVSSSRADRMLAGKGPTTAKGFVSTTQNMDVAVKFSKGNSRKGVEGIHLLEIKAKRGVRVEKHSLIQNEFEIIQAHNTKYRVLGSQNTTHKGQKVRIIQMEEI